MPRSLVEVQDRDAVAITSIWLVHPSTLLSRKSYLELNFDVCQIVETMGDPFQR